MKSPRAWSSWLVVGVLLQAANSTETANAAGIKTNFS
jgi:hypothetical protein